MLVMLIGGLWHGAQWTFIVWGGIHGAMLAIERLIGQRAGYSAIPAPVKIAVTFVVVLITWVFFRAENFEVAARYLSSMFGIGGSGDSAGIVFAQITRPAALFWLSLSFAAAFFMPRTTEILRSFTLGKAVAGLALLVLSLAVMFTQGFNPFLYFQF